MRPRHAFAALLATCLVAVAIPAAAGSSDTAATPPDLGTVTSQLTPTDTPSPSASATSGTGSTTDGAQTPAAAVTTTPAASTDPLTCAQNNASNPLAVLTCLTPTGGTNPLTGLIAQIQGLAGSGGVPGLSPAPFTDLAACLQKGLAAVPPDGKVLEACFSSFAESVTGAPQSKCLDPLLQGAIGAVQDLVVKQDPSTLEAFLTGAQATVTTLVACLQGTPTSPSPSATTSTGTTTQSGGATTPSDPTVAVPVAATPNFTG